MNAGTFDILAYKGADEATAATILKDGVASDTYTLGTGFGTGSYYYDGNVATNYYFYGYGKMVGTSLTKLADENTLVKKL